MATCPWSHFVVPCVAVGGSEWHRALFKHHHAAPQCPVSPPSPCLEEPGHSTGPPGTGLGCVPIHPQGSAVLGAGRHGGRLFVRLGSAVCVPGEHCCLARVSRMPPSPRL